MKQNNVTGMIVPAIKVNIENILFIAYLSLKLLSSMTKEYYKTISKLKAIL